MVLFGTGKFLEQTDKNFLPQRPQTFYGLVDANTYAESDQIDRLSDLQRQSITSEFAIDPDDTNGAAADNPDNDYRGRTTTNSATMGKGWYLPLVSPNGYEGERSVTDPLVRDDRVIFTTLIPRPEACSDGGSSWLMVLDLLSGARLPEAQLDTNGDNVIDGDDVPTSGVSSDQILSRPAGLLCLGGDCDADRLISSGTATPTEDWAFKSVGGARGRQSWRQIR
jgi:type IV pilus assembly protein PilY1